jgi:polyisoprenoid-binding protein YceI
VKQPGSAARRRIGTALAALLALASSGTRAAASTLELLPEQTQIHFELAATLHTVEGTLRLLRGEVEFDEAGRASGRIAIDARSADTGNDRRDKQMHAEVLESPRYPEIVFVPEALELVRRSEDRGEAVLVGRLQIHGGEHALRIPAQLERRGDRIEIDARFEIPYVAWGMRDMGNALLHVAPEVAVHVKAVGRLHTEAQTGMGPAPSEAETR